MATSKGRSSGAKSAPAKKTASRSSAAGSGGGRSGAASKSPASGGASKKSAPARSGGAPAKSAAASKAPASKSAASKGTALKSATGRTAGTATKATAAKSAGTGKAATSGGTKSAAPRSAASDTKGAATSASRSRASGRKSSPARTDGRPLSANDLEKAFKDLLKDIYYAEKKLRTALGKMNKAATHPDLKEAFSVHQGQTEDQITKLEGVFEMLGMKPQAKKCAAMDGLLEEADEHIEEYEKGPGLDAAMIVGAQKVEHYEMAAYGSLRNFAMVMGEDKAAKVFDGIREQEADTDELLTRLSDALNRIAYGSHNDQGSDKDDKKNAGVAGGKNAAANASKQAMDDMANDKSTSGTSDSDDSKDKDTDAAGADTGTSSSMDDDSDTDSNR